MRYMTGSRMLMFGEAMSIFARSVLEPFGNSPAFMRSKSPMLSSTERSRYGLFVPGSAVEIASQYYFRAIANNTEESRVAHIERWYGERILYQMVEGCKQGRSCEETFQQRLQVTLDSVVKELEDNLPDR